jgi:hypothetical protein
MDGAMPRACIHFKLVWTFISYGTARHRTGMVGEVKMSHFAHFVFLLWFINELIRQIKMILTPVKKKRC